MSLNVTSFGKFWNEISPRKALKSFDFLKKKSLITRGGGRGEVEGMGQYHQISYGREMVSDKKVSLIV